MINLLRKFTIQFKNYDENTTFSYTHDGWCHASIM